MSGAFNIDIECGPGASNKSIKIYCSSLTENWTVERDGVKLAQFHAGLRNEPALQKNGISIPPKLDAANIDECEQFLSRLGCTAQVLRVPRFHEFLNIPKEVRDGLTYASHKPFGKTLRAGYMQRHPRFVRRGGGRKYVRLTKDERGGSLILHSDENSSNVILASLKIGASTEIQNLKDKGVANGFVLRSGKRQWVLQASSSRDYQNWQSQIVTLLKEFGAVNLETNNTSSQPRPAQNAATSPSVGGGGGDVVMGGGGAGSNVNAGKLLKENQELSDKIKKMKEKISSLAQEIEKYEDLEIELKNDEIELKRKGQKQFKREKEDLIADYEVKQDNLRGEIEEMHKKLEQKTFDEGGKSGLKTLFGEEYNEIDINDYRQADDEDIGGGQGVDYLEAYDDDDEEEAAAGQGGGGGARSGAAQGGGFVDDGDESDGLMSGGDGAGGGQRAKYLHKHHHRHDHKHIHDHRHTHIHDQTSDPPISYIHTHTICHTLTHTTTQFKIKK